MKNLTIEQLENIKDALEFYCHRNDCAYCSLDDEDNGCLLQMIRIEIMEMMDS